MTNDSFMSDMAELFEVEKSLLNSQFPLIEEKWDSLAIISTIALIDQHFNLTVDGRSLSKCTSIGALLNLVEQKSKSGNG